MNSLSETGVENLEVLDDVLSRATIHDWRCFNCTAKCPTSLEIWCPYSERIVEFAYISNKYVWIMQIDPKELIVKKYRRDLWWDEITLLLKVKYDSESPEYQKVLSFIPPISHGDVNEDD
jgi:hypothetical protein